MNALRHAWMETKGGSMKYQRLELQGVMNGRRLFIIEAGLDEMARSLAMNHGPGYLGEIALPNVGLVEATEPSIELITARKMVEAYNAAMEKGKA